MLSKIEEYEFVNRLHLKRMTKHPTGWNFECPICHEGKSSGRKKRGFILSKNKKTDFLIYFCHNCGASMSFKKFLKEHEYSVYQEYVEKERTQYLDKIRKKENNKLIEAEIKSLEEIKYSEDDRENYILSKDKGFTPIGNVKRAVNYCQNRKIPTKYIKGFYYNESIGIRLEDGRKVYYNDMLVMPFYDGKKIYGYQARSLTGKTFYTFSQDGYKVYNLYNVNKEKTVFILESIIDSLFIDNSIAMVGASLSKEILKDLKDPIFVFDNDHSQTTYKRMEKLVKEGYKVVIWPEYLKEKDINEMILQGFKPREIMSIIKENTYADYSAETRINIRKSTKMRS